MNNKKWYIRIWNEGEYIDFWSFTHFLCGFILAKATILTQTTLFNDILIILALLTAWEIFEIKKGIKETAINRVVDIIIGLFGFLLFLYIDNLSAISNQVFIFIFVIPALVLGIWGYIAYLLENNQNNH